ASTLPMQPRRRSPARSVTNVAAGAKRDGGVDGAAPPRPSSARIAARAMASSVSPRSVSRSMVGKSERCIADHPQPVAGGVAGIAQIEQYRLEPAAPRACQQAVDGDRAAGLLV